MEVLGVRAVLPPERQLEFVDGLLFAGRTDLYRLLHDRLKERGYVIYAGQEHFASKIFRVANMGALQEQNIEDFLGAFEEVLRHETGSV